MAILVPGGEVPVQMAVMGLSLRDWIAVMSVPGVVEFYCAPGVELGDIARGAYEFADLMMRERERRGV